MNTHKLIHCRKGEAISGDLSSRRNSPIAICDICGYS
ncbi:hypothetical protein GNVKYODX_CDS9 [Acinetobacter phage vB_AbaM_AB3P2]|nr:hypothetical protein GNVKYODX_CDS9 [Acinetobacter phage vB_AbaM_AB3P2]